MVGFMVCHLGVCKLFVILSTFFGSPPYIAACSQLGSQQHKHGDFVLFTLVQSVLNSLEAPVHYVLTGAGAMGSATALQPFLTSEPFCCKR